MVRSGVVEDLEEVGVNAVGFRGFGVELTLSANFKV